MALRTSKPRSVKSTITYFIAALQRKTEFDKMYSGFTLVYVTNGTIL